MVFRNQYYLENVFLKNGLCYFNMDKAADS